MSDLLVGVDLGTAGTKAALFAADGRPLAEATAETALNWAGAGVVDQDADDFLRATLEAVKGCLERSGADPRGVSAIGVTGQMAGVLGIDERFEPSTPYDSWLDLRCSPDVEALDEALGERLPELSGCPAMVNHAPKMRWWSRERPDAFAATAKFVVPSAYVTGRLAGLEVCDAHVDRTYLHFTGVADTRAGVWSPELADAACVPLEKLPRIVEPATVIGRLEAWAAAQCGLSEGVPIAAGLGDTAAGVVGAGVVASGQMLDVAGTAAVLCASGDRFVPDVEHRTLIVMRGAIEGQWVSLSYMSAGSLLAWVGELLWGNEQGQAPELDELARVAARAASGSEGLIFLPHVDGRILPSQPRMRGAWIGLSRHHRQSHMVRSVLEGVAYEYAEYLRVLAELHHDLDRGEVRVVGGGARSDVWNQIKADVLGVPYMRLRPTEFSCWGAALVAGKAVGLFEDLGAAAAERAEVELRFEPDASAHELHREQARVYARLIHAADPAAVERVHAQPPELR